METILQARGLKKYYGKGETQVRALDGVDLDIERGKFTAIIGTSGSGKSTLLNMLGGLDTPTEGSIRVGDTELAKLNSEQATIFRRKQIGFMLKENPRSYVYCADLRCRENDPPTVRLQTLRAFREHLAQSEGRIEQSVECELDGRYRPIHTRKNYVTADFDRPIVVWLNIR